MESYIKLVKKKRFIGSKPVTFTSDSYNKKTEYAVTPKLDGLRILLFFCKNGVYYINSKLEFKKISPIKSDLSGTLIDGELVNNNFIAFDILYYKNKNLTELPLKKRIEFLDKISFIKQKTYLFGNTCINYNSILKTYSKELTKGIIDGVIFTPLRSYYKPILKWKPVHLLSIDFEIKKINGEFILLKSDNKRWMPENIVSILKVSKKIYNLYKSGDVLEFIWKNNKFKILRSRPDKTTSNYITVINDNFHQMLYPVNVKQLLNCK